jgi:sulfotransferase family protein
MTEVLSGAWLDGRLLALFVLIDGPAPTAPWQLHAKRGDLSVAIPIRALQCTAAEPDWWWLFCALVPDVLADAHPLGSLTLSDGEREHQLADPITETPVALGRAIKDRCEPAARGRVQAFLSGLPTSYGIELTPELAATLHQIRDTLRQPLPQTKIAPGPLCARLEKVTAIDQHTFWLTGWIHAANPRQTTLTAITPEGTRTQPQPGATTYHPRPAYAKALDDPHTTTLGFHTLIQTPNPSIHPHGWTLELQATNGHHIQDAARQPTNPDATALWDHIINTLRTNPNDTNTLTHQILPTLEHLRLNHAQPRIKRVMTFGELSERPTVSLVIAVRRLDRIEHQLGQFARDPELKSDDVELIYVTPPGTADDPAEAIVEQLQELYAIPLRLTVLSHPARRARALNLGASLARGAVLVLLSGDVLPAAPGWLSALTGVLAGSAEIGAVAPKLLREDGSIAHAGVEYVRRQSDTRWHRTLPLAGYARSVDGACHRRRIQAGSEACLVLESAWFDELDGFSELYLGEGDEAGDLCLRLADHGLQTWFEPDAELYLLDRPDANRKASPLRDPFNGWLLGHRCGAVLDGHGSDDAAAPPPPPGRRAPTAGSLSDSARPGPAIEQLELIAAEGDSTLQSGSLTIPVAGPGRLPYEGTYAFAIEGRALVRDGSGVTVEVGAHDFRGCSAAADLPSPDLAEQHPDVPGAGRAGYHMVVSTVGLPTEFELEVHAVTPDGARSSLGLVRGRRRPLQTGFEPKIQPLMVTMLGRTGSTWLMALLSRHPQIISYSPFVYEPMLAVYWTTILQRLADPASYTRSILAELDDGDWWLGRNRTPPPREKAHTEMMRWLGRENVEVMASFCQNRLDAFYLEAARVEGRGLPRFFAEKCVPGPTPRLVAELYPAGREVVLVRDMRDRLCSIRAFNARRGLELWGRDVAKTDEQWFNNLRDQGLSLLEHWRERSEHAHLLRYEDLIRDPRSSLEALLTYIGVDHDAETIARTQALAEEMRPGAQRNHQTSASVESSIGRWRDELTPEEQAACAEAFDDLLIEFGYEPTGAAAAAGG